MIMLTEHLDSFEKYVHMVAHIAKWHIRYFGHIYEIWHTLLLSKMLQIFRVGG